MPYDEGAIPYGQEPMGGEGSFNMGENCDQQ